MAEDIWIDSEVHLLPPDWCRSDYCPPHSEEVMGRVVYNHEEREAALSRATVESLLIEMEESGIERAVIMGLPWQDPEMCWGNNDYIGEVVYRFPDRFTGFGILPPPESCNIREAVRRVAEDYGLKGVKVIPSWQGYRLDDPVFEPALEEVAARDMVLMPHTDHMIVSPGEGDSPYSLFSTARRFPGMRILAPHLGGLLCMYNLFQPAKKYIENILFITTVPLSMEMVLLAEQAIGEERLAWGTDYPFNPSHDQRTLREAFENLGLSEKKKG